MLKVVPAFKGAEADIAAKMLINDMLTKVELCMLDDIAQATHEVGVKVMLPQILVIGEVWTQVTEGADVMAWGDPEVIQFCVLCLGRHARISHIIHGCRGFGSGRGLPTWRRSICCRFHNCSLRRCQAGRSDQTRAA